MLSEDKQKKLATAIHNHFCRRNHVEHCAWFYENERKNPWKEKEHKVWLEKAQYVIKGSNSNINQIMEAIDTVNEVGRLLK